MVPYVQIWLSSQLMLSANGQSLMCAAANKEFGGRRWRFDKRGTKKKFRRYGAYEYAASKRTS
ncbi:hypothetical protein K443DRAFT_679701 [Laccaria amethystina LaAM-08-1]|uniref:Uncharacterized protein n=1 Tax=Laccaria amethystina LaAM-08-1 TaxID=1095629 RepID=A0A0C9XQ80_9AGAR|nr:hypothetical protein K443DRAFT_679701 [Laccaria amethystina LaAM-08-1]